MECKNCRTSLKDGAKFCQACGTKAELERKCGSCGHLMGSNDNFCSECGTKYQEEASVSNCDVNWSAIDFGVFEEGPTRLAGVSLANQQKSWVNQFGDWVYVLNAGVWRMKEDGSELACIQDQYQILNDNNLNVNGHGIFFIDSQAGLVHLKHDGTVEHVVPFVRDVFYVYDDQIYFTSYDSDTQTASVHSCNVDGSKKKLLKSISPKPDGSDAPSYIRNIAANGKQLVFQVWTEADERSGWYLINLDGTAFRKIAYKYRDESDEDSEEVHDLRIYYIDLDEELIYTSGTTEEDRQSGFRGTVWERKLHEPLSNQSYKKLVWNISPFSYHSENFGGFYSSYSNLYFDGKSCYGFVYQHKGMNQGKTDYYYNLYTVYPNGETEFLNAGSRGGIEELAVVGDYAYFDRLLKLRAKLDGSGMEEMRDWFKKQA